MKDFQVARVSNPSRRVIAVLRNYEQELKWKGFDFSVYYDRLKKELLITSSNVTSVNGEYVTFSNSWIYDIGR